MVKIGGSLTPASNAPTTWVTASPFGASSRAATDLLMSNFDTTASTTDHTAIFNTAIAAAKAVLSTNKYGVCRIILDSRQTYSIGGAVTAGPDGQFSQINLPVSSTVGGIIEFVGMPGTGIGDLWISPNGSGTVIESTLSTAPAFDNTRGIASIIGGPASYKWPGRAAQFSTLWYSFKNVTVRAAPPVICGIDAGYMGGFFFDDLHFDTDQFATFPGGSAGTLTNLTMNTAPQACPIIFPLESCSFGASGGDLSVSGWATGPVVGELLRCRSIQTFFSPGAALNVDVSFHPNWISLLGDYDNAYGVAAYYPTAGNIVTSPPVDGSNHPQGNARGISHALIRASGLRIGSWTSQRDNGWANAALNRQHDLHDGNNVLPIDAEITFVTANVGMSIGDFKGFGAGASTTGALQARIRDKNGLPGVQTPPSVPATATAIRNPFTRDALVQVTGGTVTAITVNGIATGQTSGAVLVPTCASVSVTYSVAPTWTWQTL